MAFGGRMMGFGAKMMATGRRGVCGTVLAVVACAGMWCACAADGTPARVLYVYDGDTVKVSVEGREEKVRLVGVDTPEAPRDEKPGQPGHAEATARTRELVGAGQVRLVRDTVSDDRDTYKRLLRNVRLPDGRYLSDVLISEGLGFAIVRFRHGRMDHVVSLEREARREGRGLWNPARVAEVSWKEAPEHEGRVVRVRGKIVKTYNNGRMCFLNFHSNYKENLSAVIFAPSFRYFEQPPEALFDGATVEIVGRVTSYRGRPQVIVRFPDQIVVLD